ncbi:MAG: tetraacyldisaccharide 4'-kinase [Candidatus Aenigmatarchaeota archaeon]
MYKIKKWYVEFLEKEKQKKWEKVFFSFLCFFSSIYGLIVYIRNFFYDNFKFLSFWPYKKIISVGSLSWGGAGKTTLSLYIYQKLSKEFKVCILRRGYGKDENKFLLEKIDDVFFSKNRRNLVEKLLLHFDLFILDDGFSYRRLKRDIDIVVMSAREFEIKYRLIPAGFFRESLSSLKRAQILVLNYKEEFKDPLEVKKNILEKFPRLKVFLSTYKFKRILDFNNNEYEIEYLRKKRLAAITAIGYPKGFFNKLKELNLDIVKEISYPDHYEFRKDELSDLQNSLINEGIDAVIITYKDKYRFSYYDLKLNFYILEIDIEIDNQEEFLAEIKERIKKDDKIA